MTLDFIKALEHIKKLKEEGYLIETENKVVINPDYTEESSEEETTESKNEPDNQPS